MGILSGLFGGNDSESSNSNDLISDLNGALGIDYSSASYNQSVDEDGSSETSYDTTDFSTDLDLDNVLASMTDTFSQSDGDTGGGLFG